MHTKIYCRDCEGENVGRDAWAFWDVSKQDWVAGQVFDHAYCFDCDTETRLIAREVAEIG